MSLTAFAQESGMKFKKSPVTLEMKKSPQLSTRAGVEDVEYGYAPASGDVNMIGTGSTGEYGGAIFLPAKNFEGAKISKIKVFFGSETMEDIKVWVRSSLKGVDIASIPVTTYKAKEYNTVELNSPLSISGEGLYVGYTFTDETNGYPVAFAGPDHPDGCLISYKGEWTDTYEYGLGSVCIRVVLSGLELAENNLRLADFNYEHVVNVNEEAYCGFRVYSRSSNVIENFTVELDNSVEKTETTITPETPIPAGYDNIYESYVAYKVPNIISTNIPIKISITKVNGKPNTSKENSSQFLINVAKAGGKKRVLVEELTGTGCGFCPAGMCAMDYYNRTEPETFVGVALHQFNSSDPMFISPDKYLNINFSGAPEMCFDRSMNVHPLDDSYVLFSSASNKNPLADLEVKGVWNENETAVDITSDITSFTNGLDLNVAYVLTADGLNDISWSQANYYYGYDASNFVDLPYYDDFKEFCKGGKYATESVSDLTFNDVAIASTYVDNKSTVEGFSKANVGDKMQNKHTLNYDVPSSLKVVADKKKMNIVAILTTSDGVFVNACKAKVLSHTTGMDNMEVETSRPVAVYSLDGVQQNSLNKGINIVRMSDGKVKKISSSIR